MKLLKALLLSLMVIVLCTPSFSAEEVIRVGVLRFETKANGISQRNAESITDELTRMLTSSYSIAIIDRSVIDSIAREHRMNLAGLIDPRTAAQLGQAAGIQYLITGAVTNFGVKESVNHSDSRGFWNSIAAKNRNDSFLRALGSETTEKTENAEVTLDLRIIDVNTHEVVLSMAETGNASRTTKVSSGSSGGSANADIVSLRDSAISDAVARIGQRIKEAVAGEYPQVLRVSGGEIYLSLGATSGVKVGNRYKISFEGEEILDMRGNVIGRETKPLAIVEVDDVKNDYSTARVIKKGGNISNVQRGDRIESASSREIEDIMKRKAIPDRRPRRALGSSGLEGAELDSRFNSISESGSESVAATSTVTATSTVAASSRRIFENSSTDPSRVIPTYGLPSGEARAREQLHRNLQRAGKTRNAYDRYVEMSNSYSGDYLAMYQAGIIAQAMGKKNDAAMWFDKSLSVNPNYEPAIRAKENLNKTAPSKQPARSKKKRK